MPGKPTASIRMAVVQICAAELLRISDSPEEIANRSAREVVLAIDTSATAAEVQAAIEIALECLLGVGEDNDPSLPRLH